ncbi:uncharacterized protein LOC143556116 [Bidens hawaiensis]|uniref:uncharacterized protein LOC143556116 n=1 Tax=Bidens hawaiensis TaxID=980011 RepID=UPI00404A3289
MDFVTPILDPIVKSLRVPVKRHLGYLVSSSNKVRGMHEKVTELEGSAQDMRTWQDSSVVNSHMVPHRVPGWLGEVEEIKARKETIPTGGIGCFSLKMRYKTGKESSYIVKHIERLMKEKAEMVWSDERIPLAMVSYPRPSTSFVVHEEDHNQNESQIDSRDLIFKKALKFLESNKDNTQKMALCGMGGIGKTTMMEELKKVVKEKRMFDYIVKVVVGQNPNPVYVQQTIAEYLGEALTETTKDTRAESLQKIFENILKESKKKILVILDDVLEEFNLKDIGLTNPLPNGLKLLLTSRDESVCIQMGVEASLIIRIVVLKDEEVKKLFWEITGLGSYTDTEPDLLQIGDGIVKRCGGLPIAIKTIASALKFNKEKYAWKDALIRLQKKRFYGLDLKAIFEISYMNLQEEDLKAIFILCGLFPEDYNIAREDLLRYGWGLNFYEGYSIITARDRVHTCVDKLIGLNLLIKADREGCVKMHDLVSDFVLNNFSEVKQASIVNHNNNVANQLKEDDSYERILLKCIGMHEFPENFNHPNLALLKLMDGDQQLKFPENFYTRMEKLEVVAYENMHLKLLPPYSTNLRALCLYSCSLVDGDISFLENFINLEVLRLANCHINKLPSNIRKLKRLRLLDLTGCDALCIDDGVFQSFEKLEELYMGVSRRSTVKFTDANCKELRMLSRKLSTLELEFYKNKAQPIDVSFENLQRFSIAVGCLLYRDDLNWCHSDQYSFKITLFLVTTSIELVECKINELFRKTEILHLEVNDMSYLEDILMHPPRSSFCNLKALSISNCGGLAYLFTVCVAKGLIKLESLEIRSCNALRSMVNSENSEDRVIRFNKLKKLSLHNLPELVSLCDPDNVIELSQLTELILYGLPNITSIFPENDINISTNKPFLNKEDVIPKLEIWPYEITGSEEINNISMLRNIKVEDFRRCGSIEVLFNIDFGKLEQLGSNSNLRRIEAMELVKLRELWRIKDTKNKYSRHFICGFRFVEYIEIRNCARFKNIVTPSATNFDLRSLKDISIWSWKKRGQRKKALVKDRQEQEINTMPKKEISKVGDNMSIFAFPSNHITPNFHHLCSIGFRRFQGVEVVFDIESLSNKDDQLVINEQQPLPFPLLPYLKDLHLHEMHNLTHVWKCHNWNEFFIPHKDQPRSSFQNLTTISLSNCQSIKYLFSPLMAKLFSNLKNVCTSNCHSMEEVVSKRDDKDEDEEMTISTTINTNTTLFPHLDHLDLTCMDNLKHIGGGVTKGATNVSHAQSKFKMDVVRLSLCQYSRKIGIKECHGLSSVIPSYAAGHMQKLQELCIGWCNTMEEVFETKQKITDKYTGGCGSSSTTTTIVIPRPTNSVMLKLPDLMKLEIFHCKHLKYIFTFSTLESLKKLETLTIRDCRAMNVIVREEYVEDTTPFMDVVFPNLKSVILDGLTNLAGFFIGMDIDFQWPLLDYVMINDCPNMMVFTSGWSMTPRLKYIHTQLGKHKCECDINFYVTPTMHQKPSPSSLDGIRSWPAILDRKPWSFHSLIECILYSYHEEVFEVALEVTNNESQTVVKLPMLSEVDLCNLPNLKYIWKSNQRKILEFPNLTKLPINECNSLRHAFTCSMVGCVMQLQELHIRNCGDIKAIVKEEEDWDAKATEIVFPCLKSLKLINLSSLEGFCLGKEDITLSSLVTL